MREIRFRGLCAKTNEFVFGDLIHGVGAKAGNMYILPNIVNLSNVPHCDPLDGVKVIPETVGQYTGLKDKNGVEIYEGDILSFDKIAYLYKKCPITVIGVVAYNNGKYKVETKKVINHNFLNEHTIHFGMKVMDWIHLPEFHKSEIIGNIYENPELL